MEEIASSSFDFDVFVSYASEDRGDLVAPLCDALVARGVKVWVDYGQVQLGDSIRQKIENGLKRSRWGVVVVSPHSVEKYWTNLEWDALFALESASKCKRILPLRRDLSQKQFTNELPMLASRRNVSSSDGIDVLVSQIVAAMEESPAIPVRQGTNLYGVPRRQEGFVGRSQDLMRVRSALEEGSAPVTASISGLAGVGKSALAIELAHQFALEGAYQGGIFWLDAEDPQLGPIWAKEEIGGQLAVDVDMANRGREVVLRISRMKAPVLIILDNVASWGSETRPAPLPQGVHVHLLLTTLNAGLGGRGIIQLPLDVLSRRDARELLLKTANREIEPGVDDLLGALEGHTLAIELAGAYLSDEGTAAQYLANVDRSSVESEVSEMVRYEKTTAAALEAVRERLDDAGQLAWARAARFESQSVGFMLSDDVGVDYGARRTLRRFHLIQNEDDRWRMHRLVRAFGLSQLPERIRRQARMDFENGCSTFAERFEARASQRGYQEERAHLDALVEQKVTESLSIEDAPFVDRMALARFTGGDYMSSRELLERTLEVYRKELGARHSVTLTSMDNLAQALCAMGEFGEAREIEEHVLEVRRKDLGTGHADTLVSMNNLAETLRELGELDNARRLHEQSLELRREVFGAEDPETMISMGNLAITLDELGKRDDALELHKETLILRRKVLGAEDPDTLISMNSLAGSLRAVGDLDGAQELYEEVLQARRELLGKAHPSTVISMNNLAVTLREQGQNRRARALLNDALEIAREILPEQAPFRVTLEKRFKMWGESELERREDSSE